MQRPPCPPSASFRHTPAVRVSLVHGDDRRKNVYDALMLVDDQIRPALQRKKYVLLKPNCVTATNQLGSTHADALRAFWSTSPRGSRAPSSSPNLPRT